MGWRGSTGVASSVESCSHSERYCYVNGAVNMVNVKIGYSTAQSGYLIDFNEFQVHPASLPKCSPLLARNGNKALLT